VDRHPRDDGHCLLKLAMGAKPSLLGSLANHSSVPSARFIPTISNSCLYLKGCIESDFTCCVLFFQVWVSVAKCVGWVRYLPAAPVPPDNKVLLPCRQEV
jgi:hypothetical protein